MKANYFLKTLIALSLALPGLIQAETMYVTSKLQVGLHEDKSLNSPIIQIVPSNTALEIIKQDEQMSYVTGPNGASGWVDNSYLVPEPTATGNNTELNQFKDQLAQAETKIKQLQTQLANAGTGASGDQAKQLSAENKKLQQDFKAERMKTGKLTVELAELRKRIGQNNDNASLYKELERLEQRNKTLEIELAKAMEMTLADGTKLSEINARDTSVSMRNMLLYLAFTLVIGIGFGLYLMDLMVRRRHGGFRV